MSNSFSLYHLIYIIVLFPVLFYIHSSLKFTIKIHIEQKLKKSMRVLFVFGFPHC